MTSEIRYAVFVTPSQLWWPTGTPTYHREPDGAERPACGARAYSGSHPVSMLEYRAALIGRPCKRCYPRPRPVTTHSLWGAA